MAQIGSRSMRKARILVDASPDRVHFSLAVPVDFHLEGEAWIASCPLLDVASHGSNRKEAQEMLGEALGAFLFTCYDIGTLDEVLRDCGFEASTENRYSAASTTDRLVPFQMRQQLVQAAAAHQAAPAGPRLRWSASSNGTAGPGSTRSARI